MTLVVIGSGVFEIALPFKGEACRPIYAIQLGDDLWVLDAFQKKAKRGGATPKHEIDLVKERLKSSGDAALKEQIQAVRGSGNVFRDLHRENADVEQLKAVLAAEIIKAADREHLSVREHSGGRASPRRTSREFAMRTWGGSPWTG